MCIAIANKKGNPLSKKQFMNSWDNNSHGGGMLYKENGKLKCHYELTDKDAFYKIYSSKINKSSVLLHFRISSKGARTQQNCHPFMVNSELGFIHNGTIHTGLKDYGKERSDTWAFNDQVLKELPPNFCEYPVILDMINSKIGLSKFAFMDVNENFTIIGADKGEAHYDEKTGNWFSNKSYQKVNNFVWKGDEKVMKTPKRTPTYGRSPNYPIDDMMFSWSEDLEKDQVTPGFNNTLMEIADKAKAYAGYRDGNVMLEQFVQFRNGWRTLRQTLVVVFEDFLYNDCDEELIQCMRYYFSEVNKKRLSVIRSKYGIVK